MRYSIVPPGKHREFTDMNIPSYYSTYSDGVVFRRKRRGGRIFQPVRVGGVDGIEGIYEEISYRIVNGRPKKTRTEVLLSRKREVPYIMRAYNVDLRDAS